MATHLEFITHEPQMKPQGSIIWLHGLGADGHDFADIVPTLNLPTELHLRFVFPHAPLRPIAINANMRMRAWYDIYSLDNLNKEDETGIQQSQQYVTELIQQEMSLGISSDKIILAGFSQGGALSLYTGLRFTKPLGGIIALSCYLPCLRKLALEANPINQEIPILMAHGRFDEILPLELAKITEEALRKQNYSVQWHEYAMQHQVCGQEIQDIAQWLTKRYSATA